jgi:molybdopterin converting factor small subunit
MKSKYFKILLVLFTAIFVFGVFSNAKAAPLRERAIARVLVFEALSDKEKKELIELRKTDKEKFRAILKEKLVAKKHELEQLKENDPEKFKLIIEQTKAKIKARLAELKKNNPKKYEELKAKRREHFKKRLEYLKENDPQKYEELKKKIQEHRAIHSIENNL